MDKQELIERIEDFPCEASLVTEMIRINKNTLLGWVKELDEPQKAQVPKDIADYIEYAKENDWDLQDAMNLIADEADGDLSDWFYKDKNMDTFARAWLDGYEVEKEKRYLVKIKGVACPYLNYDTINELWFYNQKIEGVYTKTKHTRKELEDSGFGWVFSCEGIEVEEVD